MKKVCVVGSNLYELAETMLNQCCDLDREYKIVVPDKFSMLCEMLYFKQTGNCCTFNTQVVSVSALAYLVLDKLSIKIDAISSQQQALLVKKAIENCKDKLLYIKQNSSSGFYGEMSKTISQLKSSNVDLSKCDFEDGKINDFKTIFEEYQKLCVGKVDNNDLLELLRQNIKKSKVFENTCFLFVGFDSFTNQIFEIVKTLSDVCDIYVGALSPTNLGQRSFYDLDVYKKMSTTFEDVQYLMCDKSLNFCQSLIENNLFCTQKKQSQKSDFFESFVCKSFEEELDFAFCKISNMLKDGVRAGNISVAVANLSNNIQAVLQKASLYNLPVFVEESVNLCDTCLYKFFENLFDMVQSGYKTEYVKNFWQSCFVKIDMFERGQVLNMCLKKDFFEGNFKKTQFENPKFDFYVDLLFEFDKQTKSCKTVGDFCNLIKIFLEKFDCKNVLQAQAQDFLNCGELRQEKIFLQIFDKFDNALESFEKILNKDIFVLSKFAEDFLVFCQNIKISTVPIRANCIYIGDATDDFFAHVDTLFVLGASGENLPKTVYDCGLLLDKDIQNTKGLEMISPTISMINKRNKLKLFNLCLCPQKKLIVCYSLTEGKDIPSNFVLELLEIFGKQKTEITNTSLFEDFVSKQMQLENTYWHFVNPRVAQRYLMQSVGKYANNSVVTNSAFDVLKIQKNMNYLNFDNNKQNLKNSKNLFFEKGYTKVSQLESFFDCPYKHFLTYGLKLKENPNTKVDARDLGNVFHFVAECFINSQGQNFDDNQIDTFLKQTFEKIKTIEKFEKFNTNQQNKVILNLLQTECHQFCNGLKNHILKSGFKPFKTEYAFVEQFGTTKIKGFIDRVDKCESFYRVIDYKSGNPDITEKDVYFGTKIQPIVYGKVVKKIFGDCSGVFLMPLKNQKNLDNYKLKGFYKKDVGVVQKMDTTVNLENPVSRLISAKLSTKKQNILSGKLELSSTSGKQNFDQMLDYGIDLATSGVDQISKGLINLLPFKESCEFCAFRGVCGFDAGHKNIVRTKNVCFDDKSFCDNQNNQDDEKK